MKQEGDNKFWIKSYFGFNFFHSKMFYLLLHVAVNLFVHVQWSHMISNLLGTSKKGSRYMYTKDLLTFSKSSAWDFPTFPINVLMNK